MKPVKTKLAFNSVFEEGEFSTGPKLPGDEIPIPEFATGEEFATPPNKETAPESLSLTHSNSLQNNYRLKPMTPSISMRPIAYGFYMMGRGIVHPL